MTSRSKDPVLKMESEPDLPEVPIGDKTIVRNILYAAWALQDSENQCITWNVQNKIWGYVISVSFSQMFSLSLQDMLLIKDLHCLQIENVLLRNPEKPLIDNVVIGAVMVVKLLNSEQPVTFTEMEIVRVKKRHRGWFSTD
jgi:hypothetical protein